MRRVTAHLCDDCGLLTRDDVAAYGHRCPSAPLPLLRHRACGRRHAPAESCPPRSCPECHGTHGQHDSGCGLGDDERRELRRDALTDEGDA